MSGSKPGERRGGRKAGVPNKATVEIRALAREHGPDVIKELARLAKEAQSEQARISACNALLDRAYGRSQASQLIQLDLPDVSKLGGITEALTAILRSTANGELTPSEAQALGGLLETQRKAIETVELEARIEQLEQTARKK
jgi:hypothetical protein